MVVLNAIMKSCSGGGGFLTTVFQEGWWGRRKNTQDEKCADKTTHHPESTPTGCAGPGPSVTIMQNLAGSTQPAEKPMCHEFAGKLGKLTSDPFMVNRLLKAFKALRDEDSQETILLSINDRPH